MKRDYPNQPIAGVAGVIIHKNKILLTKRGNEPGYGKWGLPGGVVELGEKVDDAVKREVFEETGIEVETIKILTVFDSIRKDKTGKIRFHYILIEFLCRYIQGDIHSSDDALDAKWVPLEKLDEFDIMPFTKSFVREVIKEEL
jgi:mutator protein MutT